MLLISYKFWNKQLLFRKMVGKFTIVMKSLCVRFEVFTAVTIKNAVV
jgi:hypothetical protein